MLKQVLHQVLKQNASTGQAKFNQSQIQSQGSARGSSLHHDRHLGDVAHRIGMMTIESFFDKGWTEVLVVEDLGPCWEYNGARSYYNYGMVRLVQAHRLSLMLAGVDIPDGWHVCHRCDNPPCVNPAHLFPGTRSDNMRDMVAKGRHVFMRGDAHSRTKMTDAQVVELRNAYTGKRGDVSRLARLYGISGNQVSWILDGKRRADVGGPIRTTPLRKRRTS